MRFILVTLLLLHAVSGFCQIRVYRGYIDRYPIQLTTYSYSGGDTRAIYAYDRFDTPIAVNGRQQNNNLTLFEKNGKGDITATLVFTETDLNSNELSGEWINKENQTKLDIRLSKSLEFDTYDEVEFDREELMQPESTETHYFRLLLSKKSGEGAEVTGVRVYEKKTDRFVQEITLECDLLGLNNLSVGDYNFDGLEDFSVFELSAAGPNTSSIYILREPDAEKYFVSELAGVSLEFDYDLKLVYEHNQCCMGSRHMNSVYTVVDNKMVLLERKCLEYSDEEEDLAEVDCH